MITLREYKVEDWARITDAVEPFTPEVATEEFLEMTKRGVAVTGESDGVVMACGGVTYLNDEEGVVWLKASRKCLRYPVPWAQTIRQVFGDMVKSVSDIKIHTYILDNFRRGEKVARLIGMQKTDEMAEYNGNTYHKYTVVT